MPESTMKADTYRGWTISYDRPPIPTRVFDWIATHEDCEASWDEETGLVDDELVVHAATRDELIEAIDEAQDEWEEINGPFGVGA